MTRRACRTLSRPSSCTRTLGDTGGTARHDRLDRDAAPDLSTGLDGQAEHRFLHHRMIAIEGAHAMGGRLGEVAVIDQRRLLVGAPPAGLMATGGHERLIDSEGTSLRDAPWMHLLPT